MSLQYKTIATFQPGLGRDGKHIWIPKLTGSKQVDLLGVAKKLAERTTASEADVYLVIMGLVDLIPELLINGFTVKLDNFGSFRLHAKVVASDSPEAVSVKNIKEIRLSFRPDIRIKKQLQGAKIKKVK